MLFLTAVTLIAMTSRPPNLAVMIHGAGGGGWEYDKWKPVFEKAGWKVIARDLVPAKAGLAQTQFKDYVAQVEGWASGPHRRVVLIGASMGGPIALKASESLHPSAIVLVDAVGPKGVGEPRHSEPAPEIIRWANGPLKDTEDSMPDSDRPTILWAWKRWRDESGAVVNALRDGVECDKPKCPCLVVLGGNDTDVPHATGLALADWCHADVQSYAGMSHVGPLLSTRAEEVARGICQWLASR